MTTLDTAVFAGLCAPGMRPLVLTQMLRLWLTHHFEETVPADTVNNVPAVAGRLENDTDTGPIPRMAWRPDPTTGIAIEADWAWQPALTERRPAVIIGRNDLERVRFGINDKMQGMPVGDGGDRYENGWAGSHTLTCVGGDGAEVELLAAEVAREVNQFAPVVRAALDLLRLTLKTVGKPVQLPEGRVNWVVPITVTYAYTERWVVQSQAPPLVAGAGNFSFA